MGHGTPPRPSLQAGARPDGPIQPLGAGPYLLRVIRGAVAYLDEQLDILEPEISPFFEDMREQFADLAHDRYGEEL
jgi:hypothetical protein